ncbi:uncharacterized protein [Panulirus ornatus]|uniref:uncharacterized protein isoform X12 n=1 Tax=Panulirus ornatus TaxID=150431 RepID=UPI003A83D021
MDEGADKQGQEGGSSTTPGAPTAPTLPAAATRITLTPAAATADVSTSPFVSFEDDDKYEREDVQKKTFAKWINSQLVKGQHPPVTDLFYDLRDGTRLLALLEVLTSKTYKREKGRMRVHHLNNVSRALSILEEHSVKLVNISNEHIVDGSAKLTLGLVWAIILHWQVQGVLKDVMSDLQQTNLEKTLLAWCRQTTKGYHGVDVRNFTTSWTDGLAFNALIHSHRPQLFDWTVLARKHPYARLENAFRLANEHLNIERLLDPEDVNSQVPDKKSIMMYVMCLFQALPHESFTMESLDVSVQSDSSFSIEGSSEDTLRPATKGRPLSTASIGLSEYQRTLEEVLTWLLGAEDRLAAMPPIADTTDEVKDQFHELEELMLELTSKQGGIGDVLGEGSRLMRDGVMEEEEEEEVRVQMKLLNTRWEELRVKAMDRQSRLHEKLMSLQQKQLESLKKWLTDTEDRIANMSQVGPTTEALREQISAHQSLQQDLENEQSNINSLSNMVVVVDESNSDSTYSTLEDELNALGERWAHICRWAESRWTTLQTLSVHWEHFEQEMEKLRKWMDEKEALLRQVESNPSTEQEHILKHASMLQVLQAEMEVQHRCFDYVQEECSKILSYIPQESPAHENLSLEIETLQDRMDCLVSIIEAQTQRMAASGIDISKVMVPVDGSNDVVSSSTTTISHEGTTVVTKIITTKVTETVKGSVVKRQKLEGGSQEDFFMALHQLGGWMDSMETQVKPKAMEELSLEQLIQLCQQLENEMEAQKEEYYKVVSLGQSAISETSTIGESSKESEQQVAQVVSRWEALMEMLVEIRTRISYMTQKKKVTTELSDLEVHYQGFLRWFEDVRAVSENEPNAVTLQVEQCKTKTAAMKSHDEQITSLKVSAEALDTKWTQETQSVLQQIETFQSKWEILMQRLLEWNDTLQVKLAQLSPSSLAVPPSPPPESLLKAMEASRRWLESLETALASEYSVSTLPQMQDHLTKFKDLSEKVEMEKGNMAHINETCNKLSQDGHVNLMEDITKLNKQWETTTQALQSRIRNIEKVIDKQKQYNDEVSGLKSWLAEVDIFLQAEEAALGDIETLEAQLEQSNALQDDVATLQNNVNSITTAGKQLIEEGDSELKSIIQGQLEELVNRWNNVTELARTQNKSLKEALARSQKVHGDIDKLNVWLDDFEPKVPSVISTRTPEELSNALQMFTQLREEISTHSDDLRALNNIGDEMLQHDSVVTHEELARQFTQLNGRWTEVVAQVDSKYKLLITAAQQYEDFKKLCSEESEWLDQLQAKLERSSKDAADAEEISEALDELEIFLHSHDESRLEQIRSLAESLVREGGLAESVQETTCSLTSRFDTLNTQASEQQSGLEGSVQEAQAWEREYVSVLDYLAQSDLILNQAIADQIQVDQVQVQAELLTQQDVLKKMQRQVEVYHSQGKTEAALRLEDQITHLQRKYEEIEMKLRVCRKPCDFDTRLNQMNQQLTEISQRVHLVNLASGDPDRIQEQLNQCMGLYQTLSEVKAEVENVIATGRKIVKEGQSSDPDDLTRQLDQLKALYNQLGGAVTEQRGVLERALRHSRKIQKDSSHLEEWLSTTEYELDQHEATVPTKNVQGEVHFAQHAIDDLGRKKPLLTGLHESYADLTSLSDDPALLQPIKEQVEDIALTWERVNTRLTNRLKNMQDEQVAKENEMERFIIGLGEIKGWLESTEYQLANIGKMEPDEQDKLMKGVSLEMQNYKSQIENIRDTAVHLINHGVLFQARIQPELLLINQRWENIYKIMQEVVSRIATPPTPTKSFLSSQDVPSAVEENPRISVVTAKVVCSEVTKPAFLKQAENFSNNKSTTLITSENAQLTDSKVWVESSSPSRAIDFAGDEVPDVLDISSPIQSFATESQANFGAQKFNDDVIASENVLLTSAVDSDRKISTASEECDFVPQEVVSTMPSPFSLAETVTFPQEMCDAVELDLKTRAVLTEIVQINDSGCSNSEVIKENFEISTNVLSPRSNNEMSENERKISGAMKSFEIMFQEIPEAFEKETLNVPEFAVERSVSERAIDGLKEAVLVAPEVVFQESPYCNRNVNLVENIETRADHPFDGNDKKMSISSADAELSYTEMLEEKEQTYASEVFAGAHESCSEEVVVTAVSAINSETETRELSSSEVNGQIHMDVEVISEVSEEGIPLGCEAALIDSSVISGYEIKSQSGQGSYSGELAADEINFIRGVKSAIPSGYIFTTNAVEDDRTSEALSYFDIETSVDVQDRYGVAVTVIGTHNDLNMSLEDTEEKQIPYEEGGLEELKMESSIDFLLKSSQHSSKGTSFVDLSGGSEHKDTQKGLHDSSEKNIESKKDKLGNRSTFLTEVANLTENEYSVTFEEQSHANTVQISNQNDILKAEKKYEIDRIMENSDTGLVLPFVSQPFLHKEEKERILDTEQPFRAFQESQKLDGNFDRLQSVPQMNAKRNNNVEGKIVKKAEVSSEKDSEIDLQYVPFLPPANEIDYIVKKEDDSGEKSEIKHAEEACMEDEMTDVHYSPHCPVIKLEDEILGLESCSLADVPEIRTRKEQESKSEEFVHPTVLEHGKVSALQSVDSLHLESLTRGKPSSKSVETAVCYVPHVPPASGKDFHETPADINDIPQVSSDHSTVLLEEISVVPEEQSFANFMKLTTTTGVATPSTETDISTLKDILVEIHDVPIQRNRNISKKIPEEKLDELTEIPSYIRTSKQDVSDICTTVDSKDNEAYEKGDKSSGGGLTATRVQCKSVEAELTKNKGNIMEQGDHENRSKIHYVPYVPKSAAVSSVSPPLSPSTQGQTRKNLIFKKKDLSSIKETNITSDEEVFESAGNDGMETQSKKVQDLGIHYVPCIPSGDQHWDQGGLRKEAELSTYSDKQQFFVGEEKVPEFKTGIIEESVPIKSKSLTSSQKADIIEAQVHIPATEGKNAISGTMKETRVHEERTRSYELQYVPCSPSEFPKSVSGARPKEIHYVPHSPADVKSFECEETNTKPIMSDFIASPFSPKVDVVASPPEIMKNLRQAPTGGSVTDVADLRSSTSETAFALRSFVKESAQEQVQFPTTSVTLVSEDTQRAGQSVLELGDEIDAFLKEVTGMADKISAVKTKVQTVPSHEEAKEKVEAIEQEVALLEPDVATVISRGDTLTLTTHMVDVPRANTIRIAVNDLRTHWSSLKSETEIVKLEAEEVAQEIGSISERADEIISWSNDVLKRLHLVNNDESQLEALENEMTNKKVELDKLNETGALLKKYKYNQIQPALTLLNMRWTEISMQFRQYRKVSLEKKTIVATTQVETETEPVIVPDFVASVNRLREAVSAISRQLHASKLSGNKYDNLKAQEDELKVIKQGLETLKPRVDGLETERNTTIKSVTPAESEQVRRVMDKLREEWAQVNRGYTERHACWLQCSETWRTLQKTIDDFAVWLNSIEEKVQITANQALPDAKSTQKELEKQVTLKHRPSQTLQSMCKEVTEGMSADDGKRLQERVDSLMKRWRALLLDLAARRERIAGEEGGKDSTCSEYETLVTWVDQAQALMDAPVNVTDEASLSAHSTMVQNHLVDMTTKQASLKKLKDSKQKLVSSSQMATLETNLNKVLKTLPEYKSMVDTKLGVIKTLVADVEGLYKWTEEMRVKVALRDLTEEEIKLSKITLREKEALYENLDSTYWVLAQDAEGKGLTVAVALKVSK